MANNEGFEIVPRHDSKAETYDRKPDAKSLWDALATDFMKTIAGILSFGGQMLAGVVVGVGKGIEAIVGGFKEFFGGLAKAITGEGAEYNVITGAVNERLGPIDTAITETGKHLTQMELEVGESIREQDKLIAESKVVLEQTGKRIDEAEQAVEDLRAYEETLRNEIASALASAEQAQLSADGKSKIFYGSTNPKEPKSGDVWFKPTGDGGTTIMQFDGKAWVERSDTQEYERQLAEAKEAVEAASKDVEKFKTETLPELEQQLSKLGKGSEEFDRRLKAEAKARERELKNLASSLDSAKSSLGESMVALESSLKKSNKQLKDAQEELARVGYSSPGNVFPDPHFQDPCWGTSGKVYAHSNNGGELRLFADGIQMGRYYQPKGLLDKSMMLEPGGKYLLTATVYRNKNFPQGETITVHMRQAGKWKTALGRIPTGPVGVSQESAILTIPDSIGGGGSTIGFYVERSAKQGQVSLWDVQIVRAADDAMIIDGAVTAAKIQAGAIEASKIAAGAVTAGKLAANSVTAKNIVAGTITSNELASNSVTTKQLTANSVNASALQSNSVKAEHLVANQITGDHIRANTITGDNVLANSITATELQIRPGNLFPDPEFLDPYWEEHQRHEVVSNYGRNCFKLRADGTKTGRYYRPKNSDDSMPIRLEPDSAYRMTCWARFGGNNNITAVSVYLRYHKTDGKIGTFKMGEIPRERQVSYGEGGTVSALLKTPPNMDKPNCTIGFFTERQHASGEVLIADVQLLRAADASLIVDGAILAQHIKAGEITSNEIAAGTITGDKLKANTITGREVEAGSINANQLKVDNGFIKSAMIANGAITNAKIGNLDAGKITTGELDGKRIKADTITVQQLRANSIVPIGGSLIHHEPPVDEPTKPPEPIWWQVCDTELSAGYSGYPRPLGNPWRMCSKAQSNYANIAPPKRLVKVKPGQKYRLQFWCRGTKPDTKMYIELRDQNGAHAVKSGAVTGTVNTGKYQTARAAKQEWPVTDFSDSKVGSYLVSNFTVPTDITMVTSTIELKDDVEYVYLGGFFFNHSNGSEQGNQWIAGLSLELDIPKQEDVDRAQNEALQSLGKAQELDEKFKLEQRKQNALNNSQLMIHKDMLELLDIRTPKVYGWSYGEGDLEKNPYDGNLQRRVDSPYFESWGTHKWLTVACRGQWVGKIRVSINWTNGATDDWAIDVTKNKRIFEFTGGAPHIEIRAISVVVYPRSLMRECFLTIVDGTPNPRLSDGNKNQVWGMASNWDTNLLISVHELNLLRLKNTVTCDRNVVVKTATGGTRTIRAGSPIYSTELYPELQPAKGRYNFYEVDDPVQKEYRVDETRPQGSKTTYEAKNKNR